MTNIAVHGGPAILYSWNTFLLRHRRTRWYWLLAVPRPAVIVVLNFLLTAFFLPLVSALVVVENLHGRRNRDPCPKKHSRALNARVMVYVCVMSLLCI
jgi:hypothetical protein